MDAYDLTALFAHREVLEGLDPDGPPSLVPMEPVGAWRSVALLAGSFNPPTAAHVLLAERAGHEGFDGVLFVYARSTLGKDLHGLMPEDRLLALRSLAERGRTGVAACSAGLYADQAEAAARLFPGADVAFLVGADKVLEILDERWYEDRAEALGRLFELARLIVSPRASNGRQVLEALSRPENRRWSGRVSVLPLHPAVSDLSSTRVRGLLQSGADLCGLVPPRVADFLAEVEAFGRPRLVGGEEVEPYRLRAQMIDALWRTREWAERGADLRALLAVALSPTEEGHQVREALRRGTPEREDLERAQAAAGAG